jgi:hypothetical protein
MAKSLTVKPGVTFAQIGNKTVTFVREGMKGKTLNNLATKHSASFAIARQVVATVTA